MVDIPDWRRKSSARDARFRLFCLQDNVLAPGLFGYLLIGDVVIVVHHPELRGEVCRAAQENVQEMMVAAAIDCECFRTGMVVFTATAGDLRNVNPRRCTQVHREDAGTQRVPGYQLHTSTTTW